MFFRIVIVAAFALLSGCVTDAGSSAGSSEDISNVIFQTDEFRGIEPTRFSRRYSNNSIKTWSWKTVTHRAEIGYQAADYGMIFDDWEARGPEDWLRGWNYFKNADFETLGNERTIKTRIGNIGYSTVTVNEKFCFHFSHLYDDEHTDVQGRPTKRLFAYYCGPKYEKLSYRQIKELVGHISIGPTGQERPLSSQ